jgi:hypothetical protein
VDIAGLNGTPVLGHQQRGGIVEQAVKRLMALQGPMRPAQIISLLALGGNTLALRDHADHIHVGFGEGSDDDSRAPAPPALLRPGQWDRLVGRVERMDNPRVRGGQRARGLNYSRAARGAQWLVGLPSDLRLVAPLRPLAPSGVQMAQTSTRLMSMLDLAEAAVP